MSVYLSKHAQNWHKIYSKYQECKDIYYLNDLEVFIYQQFVYHIFWDVLGASYEHSLIPFIYILSINSLYHDFYSNFHIA